MNTSSLISEEIQSAVNYIHSVTDFKPDFGIILGTGLAGLSDEIDVVKTIEYNQIPNFPLSTVKGHDGKLVFGKLGNKNVIAMKGRFHFYEGYSMQQVVFPIRVMKKLGIRGLIVSNASGGVNPDFSIGDIMIINDHINLFPTNPLIGTNDDTLGPRFPDMSESYKHAWIEKANAIAKEKGIKVQNGVYAGLTGPCLETPAEYYYIRAIGADTVGMSTVPEVIAARHMGTPCFAVSIITDLGVKGKIEKTTHEDVLREAAKAEPHMTYIIKTLLNSI
jgi:purine-nucleoside phosphorylase